MKHIERVLKEMFKRVGQTYSKKKVSKEGWYMKHSWTEKEQDKFSDWLVEYLYKCSEARREIMNIPIKNKKYIRRTVNMFILGCGWKLK